MKYRAGCAYGYIQIQLALGEGRGWRHQPSAQLKICIQLLVSSPRVQFLHICVSASEDSSNPGSCSPTYLLLKKKSECKWTHAAVTCAAQG